MSSKNSGAKADASSAANMALRDNESRSYGDDELNSNIDSGYMSESSVSASGRKPRSARNDLGSRPKKTKDSNRSIDSRDSLGNKRKSGGVRRAVKKSLGGMFRNKKGTTSPPAKKFTTVPTNMGPPSSLKTDFNDEPPPSESSRLLSNRSSRGAPATPVDDLSNDDLLSPLSNMTSKSDDEMVAEGTESSKAQNVRGNLSFEDSFRSDDQSKSSWQKLKNHVDQGDVLLMSTGHSTSMDEQTDMLREDRNTLVEKAINEMRAGMEFNSTHALIAIAVYMAVAVICYNFILEPDWSIIDCCYFSVVTFSTVGYGDISPSSEISMLFTCIYAIIGIAILGNTLGIIGSDILEAQQSAIDSAGEISRYEVLTLFEVSSRFRKEVEQAVLEEDTEDDDEYDEDGEGGGDVEAGKKQKSETSKTLKRQQKLLQNAAERDPEVARSFCGRCFATLMKSVPMVAVLVALAWVIGHCDGQKIEWDWIQTMYYLVITACTIGYGDMTPGTQYGKVVAIIFIPVACGAVGQWLGFLANSIIERRAENYWRQVAQKELTLKDLELMDNNGDGKVTRAEFLEFMLVAMNKIDQELLDELRLHFDKLDSDGTGELSRGDLVESARLKLKSPRHKLKLAAYKAELLKKGKVAQITSSRRMQSQRFTGDRNLIRWLSTRNN